MVRARVVVRASEDNVGGFILSEGTETASGAADCGREGCEAGFAKDTIELRLALPTLSP